jgi:proteasome lid subunit RPN8/RPN11
MNTNPKSIRISQAHWQEMENHLRQAYPEEGCGLLAGRAGHSRAVLPVPNQLRSPHRFFMEPIRLLQALEEIDARGWDLLAIYHSHPHGQGSPSAEDLQEYHYPGTPMLIWFPVQAAHPDQAWDCRAYAIAPMHYLELGITLEK